MFVDMETTLSSKIYRKTDNYLLIVRLCSRIEGIRITKAPKVYNDIVLGMQNHTPTQSAVTTTNYTSFSFVFSLALSLPGGNVYRSPHLMSYLSRQMNVMKSEAIYTQDVMRSKTIIYTPKKLYTTTQQIYSVFSEARGRSFPQP